MIYSAGYATLRSPSDLVWLCTHLDAAIVDVRGKPVSRKRGFGGNQLAELLGTRYVWRGDTLGNKGGNATNARGLDWLETMHAGAKPNVILLCLEECPGECHRHFLIGAPLAKRGIEVRHLFDTEEGTAPTWEVVTAQELEAAFDEDRDEHRRPLSEVL